VSGPSFPLSTAPAYRQLPFAKAQISNHFMKTKLNPNMHAPLCTASCFKYIGEWSVVLLLTVLLLVTSCVSKPAKSPHAPVASVTQAAKVQSQSSASYTVDVTVVLSSTFTQGRNRIRVELRRGVPGASKLVDTQYFEGQTGTVCFSGMSAERYFIAIGNGDSVAVGPVRQFSEGQSVHTRVRVSQSSGNVGTRSRSSL